MTAAIGFLHTAAVHVARFSALVHELAPGARDVHVVDPALLARARARGISPDLRADIAAHVEALAARADAIVCTCSSVGGEAERAGEGLGSPVLRVDRPMAEAAVRAGRRVAVVATVESTLEPTRALLEACAGGRDVEVVLAPCLEAWPLFERGDLCGYEAAVAAHVRRVAGSADVVVLAQASMADVEPRVAGVPARVLSSPRPAAERALALARGG